jgi:hypothetical protein
MPEDFKEKPQIAKYLEMFKDIRENIESHINVGSALNFLHKYGSLISQFRNVDRKTFMKKVGATARAFVKKKINVYKNKIKNKIKSKIKNITNKVKSKVKKSVKNTVNKVKAAVKENIGDLPEIPGKDKLASMSSGMKKFQNMKSKIQGTVKVISSMKKAVEIKNKLKKSVSIKNNVIFEVNENAEKIQTDKIHEKLKDDTTTVENSENVHLNTQENNSLKKNEENKNDTAVVEVAAVENHEQEEEGDCFSYKEILESVFINHQTNFKKDLMYECVYNMDNELDDIEEDFCETDEQYEQDEDEEQYEHEQEEYCESSGFDNQDSSPASLFFEDHDFEKFVLYLEIFVNLFTGIQVKYFIDELGCLNMDFYSSEDNLMTLAELMHYQLQFRIMNTTQVLKYDMEKSKGKSTLMELNQEIGKNNEKLHTTESLHPKLDEDLHMQSDLTESLINTKEVNHNQDSQLALLSQTNFHSHMDEEIFNKNKLKYEELDIDDVSLFPPFADFSKQNAQFFRRYDHKDNYHICPECSINKLKTQQDCLKLTCSSLFREIDKARVITNNLNSLLNINIITNPPDDEPYMKDIFKMFLILHNYDELADATEYTDFLKGYSIPLENKITRETNKVWRNTFGEDVGFYFTWVTHYLSWLIFPAIMGTILYFLGIYFSVNSEWNMYLYFSLFLSGFVITWANLYLTSWKSREEFLLHTWGMKSFKLDKSNEMENVPVDKWVFMGIKMPIISAFKYIMGRTVSALIIFLSLCTTMFLNLLIFYIETSHTTTMNRGAWAYITPMCTFLIRENMSSIYKDIAVSLTNGEYHIHKPDYNSSLKIKIIFFEFFNYYFNLYYIAFVKPFINPNVNCYNELGSQLTGILISAITVDFTKLFWNAVYLKNKTKEFEKSLKDNNPNVNNASSKYIYYTRTEYESTDVNGEFLDIILNYGYIIQFGASSPICFFIALLQTLAMRFMDSIKFSKLQYCKLISNSNGIGVYYKVMKLMNFLGLITNVCVIIFTNPIIAANLEFSKKMMMIIIIENLIIVFNMLSKGKSFPFWFKFKDKVEMLYLKKYSSRVNKDAKKSKKDKK